MDSLDKAPFEVQLNKSIFTNKNFILLFLGKVVSNLGDMIYIFAISWFILDVTGSAVYSGTFAMLGLIPTVITMPFGGVIADNFDRKKIIVNMDLVRGVTLILLTIIFQYYNSNITIFYIAAIILGFCNALFRPACSAIIPNIVEENHLTKANSLNAIAENGCNIIGVLAGGLLYSLIGMKTILLINGISFIISGISEMFISLPDVINSTKKPRKFNKKNFKVFMSEIVDGISYLKTQKSLYVLFLFAIALNFLSAPIGTIFIPYIFNQVLKTKALYLSYVNVSVAAGYIIGALIISSLPSTQKFFKRIMGGIIGEGVLFLTVAIPIWPTMIRRLTVTQITLCYIIGALILGFVVSIVNISIGVVFQKTVKDEFRGRVTSLLSMLSLAAMPLGYLIGGILVDTISTHIVILVMSIILAALSICMYSNKAIQEL